MSHTIRTCLWFRDGRGREAADFYCSLIPGSRVENTFTGDAGPAFTLTEAVSISVATDDQAETDQLWAALTADGGEESVCGWLKDRYGVSWQIFPRRLTELTTSADKKVSDSAIAAMMKQRKIDIAAIEAAVREAA